MDIQVILEQIGDPAEVDRGLQRFRKAARVTSSQRSRLIDRYPRQWIAVYDGKVKAHGTTLQSVMERIDKQGLPREHTIVRFIEKDHRTMIL